MDSFNLAYWLENNILHLEHHWYPPNEIFGTRMGHIFTPQTLTQNKQKSTFNFSFLVFNPVPSEQFLSKCFDAVMLITLLLCTELSYSMEQRKTQLERKLPFLLSY